MTALLSAWQKRSVLIVGCGSIGRRHGRVLQQLGVTDIRITDPQEAQRAAFRAETKVTAEYASFEAALQAGPDTVFICTPPALHVAQSIAALAAGAHVFCEKPLADSPADIARLAAAVQQSGRVFAVGFCMRHHAALRRAKTVLESGRIGRLVSIRCRMGEHLPTVRPDYRTLSVLQEVGVFDLAHEVDLACWFASAPVTAVAGFAGAYSELGFVAPDVAEIIVRFGPDCLASVHLDWFGSPRLRQTELIGTLGTLLVEYASWETATVSVFARADGIWEHETIATARDDMFAAEDREFLEATCTGGAVSCDLAEAAKSLGIIDTLLRKA